MAIGASRDTIGDWVVTRTTVRGYRVTAMPHKIRLMRNVISALVVSFLALGTTATAQVHHPICAQARIESDCGWAYRDTRICETVDSAYQPRPPKSVNEDLIALSLPKRGSLLSNIDLIEARLIACGLAEVGEDVTARSVLDDEITGLHADFARYWQGGELLPALAELIVAQYDLGFRDDALKSLKLFDHLAGGAEPLGQVVMAQLELGGHMARLREFEFADRYFASVELLWPLLPDHEEKSRPRVHVDTLVMIAHTQIEAGAFVRGAETLDRADAALANAQVADETRSILRQAVDALRDRLDK
jgi:hypothetical protein